MLLAALNYHSIFFWLFSLVACGFALAVLATSNVVRMAFYLTLALGSTAGLFFLAGAEFLGAMQFMIYVGGTLVLLIFGVMLTAQSRFISMQTHAGEWILGGIVGAVLLALLLRVGFSVEAWSHPMSEADRSALVLADSKTSTPIGLALSGIRVDRLNGTPAESVGKSGYLLPFVIVSMHLLVVLIGAGYMARSKKATKGTVLDRTAPMAVARPIPRYFLVTGGVVSGSVANLVLCALSFTVAFAPNLLNKMLSGKGEALASLSKALEAAPAWLFPALGLLFLVNVLLLKLC